MRGNKYFEEFGKPFADSDISWKLQLTNKEKTSGLAVAYLDARAIADRLDAVVGQNRWKDEYMPWHNYVTKKDQKFAQLCTIYIYDDELKEWIGKTDGAEDSDIEPIKGGLSDAFKRAAVRWNIGRYLYRLEPVWVTIEPRGDSYIIAKNEYVRLNKIYNNAIVKLFGTIPNPKQPAKSAQTEDDGEIFPVYEVKAVKVEPGKSGMRSRLILQHQGKQYNTFMQGSDERLKQGSKIINVDMARQKNSYGEYHLLNKYDIAA